jgi:protease I
MKAVILVADGVEDLEFFYPYYRFQEMGIDVDVVSPRSGSVTGKHGYTIETKGTISGTKAEGCDIVILPGGKAPETLRSHPAALELVKHCFAEGKIVASICHGAQILISANVLDGRKATCAHSIKDDIIAAGADYRDEAVVVDGNLITSRTPEDLPHFCRAIFQAIPQASV